MPYRLPPRLAIAVRLCIARAWFPFARLPLTILWCFTGLEDILDMSFSLVGKPGTMSLHVVCGSKEECEFWFRGIQGLVRAARLLFALSYSCISFVFCHFSLFRFSWAQCHHFPASPDSLVGVTIRGSASPLNVRTHSASGRVVLVASLPVLLHTSAKGQLALCFFVLDKSVLPRLCVCVACRLPISKLPWRLPFTCIKKLWIATRTMSCHKLAWV